MSTTSSEVIPPALADRPLLDDPKLSDLERLFRILGNATRLKILHSIARSGDSSVGAIAQDVGSSIQNVSNHLQRLADQNVVATTREGNRVNYRLIDPCVGGVMELGLCLLGHDSTC